MNTKIKSNYLIIGVSLILSACAQEDMPGNERDVSDNRIVFHTSLPGVVSRAKVIATDLSYFYLTTFDETDEMFKDGDKLKEYINNLVISKDSNSDIFVSDKCFWPDIPGQESDILNFFAYYPELPFSDDSENDPTFENSYTVSDGKANLDYKILKYSIAPDIAEQVDFVTAYATGSKTDNLFSGIELNFKHQLSRIEVKAWGANKSCDIEIAGVRIGGVNVEGTFDFNISDDASVWSAMEKGVVEYIYREGDEIITLLRQNELQSTLDAASSIMGANLGYENNCAMLIPTVDETGWEYRTDIHNENQGMYISVLLRVIDTTKGKQQYPDNKQDENALNIPVVYLAVDSSTGEVKTGQLYKGEGDKYFTDLGNTEEYNVPEGCVVKEFGWAALPITGKWEPGKIYTYTLDYSYGVGLHDPGVPNAGDPIISDKVLVNVKVSDWEYGDNNSFEVPRN